MATPHRYWRLRILSIWGGEAAAVGTLSLASSVGGTNLATTGNGTALASNYYVPTSATASKAFDGNDATWWGSEIYGSTALFYASNPYLGWDFGSGFAHDIQEIKITSLASGTLQAGRSNAIRSSRLEYSDDGTTWTTHITLPDSANGAGTTTFNTIIITATAALAPPSPALSGFAGASCTVTSPQGNVVSSSGAWLAAHPPTAFLAAVGHDATGENSVIAVCPSPLLTVGTGASGSFTAPMQTLAATGTVTGRGVADLAPAAPTLTAGGTTSGLATAALRPPSNSLVGYGGAVASISINGHASISATGVTGAVGGATLTAPLFDLSVGATAQNHGSAILAAPIGRMATTGAAWLIAPGAQLTAIGAAVVAITHEAYALNLKHLDADSPDELTHYTNYPFDKIVRYQNSYFGMNSTGLYLLEGTTDFAEPAPTPVLWAFKTAMTDFELPNLKTVNWAYFGGRLGPAATISIHYGDTGEQNYAYTTPRGSSAQNYRQAFGRGIKSRYYAFEAEGAGVLSLDSIMFDVAKSARKV